MDAYLERQICARIKQARIEAGFTQEDLAGLLNVTTKSVQNYESKRVPFRRLDEIAKLTGVEQDWLLRGDPATHTDPELAADVVDALEELSRSQESVHAKLDQLLVRLATISAALSSSAGGP